MFDVDKWQEILATIAHNKLRTFLTGFAVAWGIFMLVILLGSGRGLRNGIAWQFRDDAVNSIWVRSGTTSVPHQGFQPGRSIQLTNDDHAEVSGIQGVEHITSRFYVRGEITVSYGSEHGTFDIRSVHPGHQYLENTIITAGRFLNDRDIREYRKVAVIGDLVEDALFGGETAMGEYIEINGIPWKVVGIFEDLGGEGEREKIYLPITTAQRTFNGANRVSQIMFTTGALPLADTEALGEDVKARLAQRHHFAVGDDRAVSVSNLNLRFQRFLDLMGAIDLFVWIVGFGTILAGVVGVSNIMMIVVKERTREIGVRKALGATPWSIVSLILQESVLITGVAGYLGLVAGVAVLELVAANLPAAEMFRQPGVDLSTAIAATALLVVSGGVAGLFPAVRAARVRPIEALREE